MKQAHFRNFRFTVLFLFGFFCIATAQPPGYLGKRQVINLNFSAFPAFENPVAYDKEAKNFAGISYYGMNKSYGLRYSYVVRRNLSVFASGEYLRTALYESYFEDWYDLSVKSAGIGAQFFNSKKAALAPVGDYINVEILYNRIEGNRINTSAGVSTYHPKTSNAAIRMEFGKNFVLQDRLVLNIAAFFSLCSTPLEGGEPYSREQFFSDAASDRVKTLSRCMLRAGIGYLF